MKISQITAALAATLLLATSALAQNSSHLNALEVPPIAVPGTDQIAQPVRNPLPAVPVPLPVNVQLPGAVQIDPSNPLLAQTPMIIHDCPAGSHWSFNEHRTTYCESN